MRSPTKHRIRHLTLLAAFTLACFARAPAATVELDEPVSALPQPAIMTNFIIYIAGEGVVRQEVSAATASLYQQLGVTYLRRIHVDFLDMNTGQKDTLDAPEGYLYIRDFKKTKDGDERLGPSFPFYQKIGGKEANIELATTTTRLVGELPNEVARNRNDIDLLGRPESRVVYRRSDGTSVTCLRAYRDAKWGKIYGVGQCELHKPSPDKNQPTVISGAVFVTDDKAKGISIRGAPSMKGVPEGDKTPQTP